MKKVIACAVVSAAFASYAAPKVVSGEKICFLGDSITQFGNHPAGYVNMVMLALDKAGIKAEKIPAGISGHKSSDMLARLDRDVISKKPDWMTLYCGVNDVWHQFGRKNRGCTIEEYRRNISQILSRAAASGIKVVLLTPSMISENPKDRRNLALGEYIDFIRSEAKRRSLLLADVSKALWHEVETAPTRKGHVGSKVTSDGVHMNWYGDRVIALEILACLGVDRKYGEAAATELRKVRNGRYWFSIAIDPEQRADLTARAASRGLELQEYAYRKMSGAIGPDGGGKGKLKADKDRKHLRIGVSFDRFEELEDMADAAGVQRERYYMEMLMR